MEEVLITTQDGLALPGTLFQSKIPPPEGAPVVLISSATAAPRRIYRHFAQYLVEDGARAVLTYDYRGLAPGNRRARRQGMADWATRDMPAAVAELQRRYPRASLTGLGHSFGGQALGLSGVAQSFRRYMTLAAGSGYLGHTRQARKLWITMNLLGYPIASLLGYLPAWAGMGEDVPFGAFNQWRRWCNSPDYFMSDPSVPETGRFSEVRIPMVAVGFEDDPWATRESVRALVRWYENADIKIRWFTEEEAGGPVGHFGFFRPDHRETLWPQIADWLTQP